jgi:hypothetical protein
MLLCDCPKCNSDTSILLKYVGRRKIPEDVYIDNPFKIPLLCSKCWKVVFPHEDLINFRQV